MELFAGDNGKYIRKTPTQLWDNIIKRTKNKKKKQNQNSSQFVFVAFFGAPPFYCYFFIATGAQVV